MTALEAGSLDEQARGYFRRMVSPFCPIVCLNSHVRPDRPRRGGHVDVAEDARSQHCSVQGDLCSVEYSI